MNQFGFYRRATLVFLLVDLAACAVPATVATTPPSPLVSTTYSTPIVFPSLTPIPSPTATRDWSQIAAGIERREVEVVVPGTSLVETLILFRLDPAAVTIRVHYTPGRARAISTWVAELSAKMPAPLLVVNGGYFSEDNHVTAFTVADGRAAGASYVDFGGMFSLRGGEARVRSLTVAPWRPDERFDQAVQGFPVLVRPGRTPYTNPDGMRSRRTAIAQTATGAIVIVVAPRYTLTLTEFAAALIDPELDLAIAVNLDGGSSTGYWARPGDNLESDSPVPAVIGVYPTVH